LSDLYPEIEPYDHGWLEVGDRNLIFWETCGSPSGKSAVVVHGGPGSGCTPHFRRFFNPRDYRVVLFDQRNCGRSLPHAGAPDIDLAANTTHHLIRDMDLLRRRLGIERWLVVGGSWGSTLSLAYSETYPERVTGLILFGVTTGRHSEIDWAFRGGLATFFPEQWDRLVDAVPPAYRGGDIVDAYHRWLNDADPEARRRAAEEWCTWESATPDWPPKRGLAERFRDPAYALAFSRIVAHYIRRNVWLKDGILIENAGAISNVDGFLVNGRLDFQAPLSNAWELKRVWPRAELVIVDEAGHGTPEIGRALVRATDHFVAG
jgi:proline iminopeptidase